MCPCPLQPALCRKDPAAQQRVSDTLFDELRGSGAEGIFRGGDLCPSTFSSFVAQENSEVRIINSLGWKGPLEAIQPNPLQ